MASENVSSQSQVGFIGFVTRKDKDTGVTLRAKIVTPNKKLSTVKDFKVKVKANALDDYSCCVIDHAAMKKIIENTQDMDSLSESFQFLYNGEHGTSITYTIEDDGSGTINNYLSDDGTLSGRPKYSSNGSSDASGKIKITVTKGDAKVESRIMVTVKGMSADEVLNSDKVYSKTSGSLKEFLWNKIKGANDNYGDNGFQKIRTTLEFNQTKTIYVDEISDDPITCEWTIDRDEIADYIKAAANYFPNSNLNFYTLNGGSGNCRICVDPENADYGKVILPAYKDCADAFIVKNTNTGYVSRLPSAQGNAIRNRRFRIGPIDGVSSGTMKLKAVLRLGDAKPLEVIYDVATVSKAMTNEEVADWLKDVIQVKLSSGNMVPSGGTAVEIPVPDMASSPNSATTFSFSIFGDSHFTRLAEKQYSILDLDPGDLANAIYIKNNPALYSVEANGQASDKEYPVASLLFNGGLFVKSPESDDTVFDEWRVSIIEKGSAANNNGFYKADEILTKYADLQSFMLEVTYEVSPMADNEDSRNVKLTKMFTLKRAS